VFVGKWPVINSFHSGYCCYYLISFLRDYNSLGKALGKNRSEVMPRLKPKTDRQKIEISGK
jgi:hypothetical protein